MSFAAGLKQLRQFEFFKSRAPRTVAYFCAEYALDDSLPTCAGGLGILAGDVVREAGDMRLPLAAVGLMYHKKYYDVPGEKHVGETEIAAAGLVPVKNADGSILTVKIPIQDRQILARAWKWQRGTAAVYLLDADVAENTPNDRLITSQLYITDKETRFKQQIILGIGGPRLLDALNIHPFVYHLNEGHPALLSWELVCRAMHEKKISFDEAVRLVKERVVFTNHTIVNVGSDVYSNDLVALSLSRYAEEMSVPIKDLISLGLVQESAAFSLTMLSLRTAKNINAVSKLHAKMAGEIWTDHPMAAITNGIHIPTWDMLRVDGAGRPGDLWKAHRKQKTKLLNIINRHLQKPWKEGELLVGWARRFVGYKRPMSPFGDVPRLLEIARDAGRPVRLVISGLPPPNHEESRALYEQVTALIKAELADVAIFLEGYNAELAKILVSGSDVWMNTPVVGFEACGTSGMKAALNGALALTTEDGWVAEIELEKIGWKLDDSKITESILDRLAKDIAPLYYSKNSENIPELWEEKMKKARGLIMNQFSASRMVKEYIRNLYPADSRRLFSATRKTS